MKQILENLRTGQIEVAEVPKPSMDSFSILVCNEYSLISSGTEKMLVDFGTSSFLGKAMQQPVR